MNKVLKFLSISLLSCSTSMFFAFVIRMFPEKAILLIGLRLAATAILFLIWKFAEDTKTKQIFGFITTGSLLGMFAAHWDEIPVVYMTHTFECVIAFIVALVVLVTGVSSYGIKSIKPED